MDFSVTTIIEKNYKKKAIRESALDFTNSYH
jgi:hypothetical protein